MNGSTSGSLFSPVTETERVNAIDVIRGVALLGILLMNIVGMGLPDPAYWDPSGFGGDKGWNLRAWLATSLFFEGTMRGIFSMLFGAGVILFTAREKGDTVNIADAWYRRTIWLVLFGVVHSYILLWTGEILYAYGLIGMFLFPLRNVRPGKLFALGMTLLLLGAGAYFLENAHYLDLSRKAAEAEAILAKGEEVPRELKVEMEAWQAKVEEMQPSAEVMEEKIKTMQGGYLSAFQALAPMSFWMESYFHYRYSYFDILSMMLIGMALFKWRVFHAELPNKDYLAMIFIGYGIGLPVNWYEATTYMQSGFALTTNFETSRTYDLGRLAMISGHIGVAMLLCRNRIGAWLLRRLAATGRMALTNYIMHTVIATTVFVIFKQYGKWERHQLYYLVMAIWIFQLGLMCRNLSAVFQPKNIRASQIPIITKSAPAQKPWVNSELGFLASDFGTFKRGADLRGGVKEASMETSSFFCILGS